MGEGNPDHDSEEALSDSDELLRRVAAAPRATLTTPSREMGQLRSVAPPALGDCIDERYRLDDVLGEGGMGIVFAATNLRTQGKVALKFMHLDGPPTAAALGRFQREARIGCSLQHPNVVRMFDVGYSDSGPYIAMECLSGRSLARRLGEGPLSVEDAVYVAASVARGAGHAHRLGLVHRDIKPGNIFLAAEPLAQKFVPKLLDFGVSRWSDPNGDGDHVTRTGATVGTPAYMPLEQLRGQPVDARSDVFSVGVVLFEALTGRLPFASDNPQDLAVRLATQRAPRLDSLRKDIPRHLVDACAKALEREPRNRFQDCVHLGEALTMASAGRANASTRRLWLALTLVGLAAAGALWTWRVWGEAGDASAPPTNGMLREDESRASRASPAATTPEQLEPTPENVRSPLATESAPVPSSSALAPPPPAGQVREIEGTPKGANVRRAPERRNRPGPAQSKPPPDVPDDARPAQVEAPPPAPPPAEPGRELRTQDF